MNPVRPAHPTGWPHKQTGLPPHNEPTSRFAHVLRSCLPLPPKPDIDMSAGDADGNEPEEFEAYEVDAEEFGKMKGSAGGGQAYDSDDESGGGGAQRVQCAQQ